MAFPFRIFLILYIRSWHMTNMSYNPFSGWTPLHTPGCGGGRSPTFMVRHHPNDCGASHGRKRIELMTMTNGVSSTSILSPRNHLFELARDSLNPRRVHLPSSPIREVAVVLRHHRQHPGMLCASNPPICSCGRGHHVSEISRRTWNVNPWRC